MTRSAWLGLTIAAGAVVYFAALLVLGVRPAQLRLKSD
jgi:peptidoglycan biosynthesis protein MviN/MurJ (putative lipid II flippase)